MVRILKSGVNDDALAGRLRDDDQRAFELLYNRYSGKIYSFSIKYLQNKAEAEDLVQTVFINIWVHRKTLDISLSIKSYIYRSVTNMIYNYLKSRSIRSKYIENELRNSVNYSNITYEQVFSHDLEETIDKIVTTLPAQQQRIFTLSRGKGYNYGKIAEVLDISVRTVENQIYRTLKTLRKGLSLKV